MVRSAIAASAAALLASVALLGGCTKPASTRGPSQEQAKASAAPSSPTATATTNDTGSGAEGTPIGAAEETKLSPPEAYQFACFVIPITQGHPMEAPPGGGEIVFSNLLDAMTKTTPANLTDARWERDDDGSWILRETYEDKMAGATHQMARRFVFANPDEQRGSACKGLVTETRIVNDGREATGREVLADMYQLGQRARSVQDTQ